MAKLMVFLKAVDGEHDHLLPALRGLLAQRFPEIAELPAVLQVMTPLADDPFNNQPDEAAVSDVTLILTTRAGQPLANALAPLEGLAEALPGLVDREASFALAMREQRWVSSPPQERLFYHYLMVRRADFSAADYEDYYLHYHSRFGFKTPNLLAYRQNVVSESASCAFSEQLGLGVRSVDSISEMHIENMERFISDPELWAVGEEAVADEMRFVDRDASVSFCSELQLQLGTEEGIEASAFGD